MKKNKIGGLKKLELHKETVYGFGQSETHIDTVNQSSCDCPDPVWGKPPV